MRPEHYNPAWREAIAMIPSPEKKVLIRQIGLVTDNTVVLEVDLTTIMFLFPEEQQEIENAVRESVASGEAA